MTFFLLQAAIMKNKRDEYSGDQSKITGIYAQFARNN
jgi:hypothetical protein